MDGELHFVERGSGEPLILLHGNGEDGAYFAHQVEFFQREYRVIALDTRGHGASPRGTAPFTLGQFACDLEHFMSAHGIATAHLLGFSDGANIALLFALAHPPRVRSLILNSGNLYPEGLTEQTRREIEEGYRAALAEGDQRALELLRLMMDEPHVDPRRLQTLNVPTLVLAGTDDMIEESHTRLIAEAISGARLCFIEGSHFVASENPLEFNRAVAEFLRATSPGASCKIAE